MKYLDMLSVIVELNAIHHEGDRDKILFRIRCSEWCTGYGNIRNINLMKLLIVIHLEFNLSLYF
jgi:hypothetical protein